MSRYCNQAGCGAQIKASNKTGLCQRHYRPDNKGPARRCSSCNDELHKTNRSGKCGRCKSIAARNRVCKCCKKPLGTNNITGLCIIHYRESIGVSNPVHEAPARIPAFTLRQLMLAACKVSGVTEDRLCGEERRRPIVTVRQAMAIAGRTEFSASRIGRMLRRDHSTILHAQDRAQERMGEPNFADLVARITTEATAMKQRELNFAKAEVERLAA